MLNVIGTSAGITLKFEPGANDPGEELNRANPTLPNELGRMVTA